MNRFAELLDRLAYEPRRNAKIRLMSDYFRTTPDPERGFALAAMTGALTFANAKPGIIRNLIAERTDPVLFGLSYDYVGDLSETVALMWPVTQGSNHPPPPSLAEVVEALTATMKPDLPHLLARWLDGLDETGRWALLKLVTGNLRIGVSARLAKTARGGDRRRRGERGRGSLARSGAALRGTVRLGRRPWRAPRVPRRGALPPAHAVACAG